MRIPLKEFLALFALSVAIVIGMAAHRPLFASKNVLEDGTDLSIVLHRTGNSIELFIKMPAQLMQTGFGLPLDRLKNADGSIDYARLRQGSFDLGDELISGVVTTNNGETIVFEAMSLMVHPKTEDLAFHTPVEAELSVSVCLVEGPDGALAPHQLKLYSGFIGYTDEVEGQVSLQLPNRGRVMSVQVHDYTDRKLIKSYVTSLGSNGLLNLQGSSTSARWKAAFS